MNHPLSQYSSRLLPDFLTMIRPRWQPDFAAFYTLAFLSLCLVTAVYMLGSFQRGSADLQDVSRAANISSAYFDALVGPLSVSLQGNAGRPITPEAPGPRPPALDDAAKALRYIQENGSAEDRAVVAKVLGPVSPEVFLGAISGIGSPPAAGAALPEPSYAAIEELRRKADQRHLEAAATLEEYRASQKFQFRFTLLGFALGLPLMFGLLEFIRRSERRQTEARFEIQHLGRVTLTDSLTDLGNHRHFQEQLSQHLAGSTALVCLAVLDMDELKRVNDNRGHAYGDRLLVGTARLLEDTIGHVAELFRVGGDEFAVLFPNCDLDTAFDRLRAVRARTATLGNTLSIGLAQAAAGDDSEALREKADSALYVAKRRGRDTIWRYTEGEASGVYSTRKIDGLRRMLSDGEMGIAFQPIWSAATKSIVALEALARIPRNYEVSGPEEAFDIADRVGHSFDLDRLCIRTALARADSTPPGILIFLNISPRTLEHADFSVPWLVNEVRSSGLEPEQICIEITERSMVPMELLRQHTIGMRRSGFKIALDDVGAGNSGLEILREIGVDFVKIDRSVLVGAVSNGASRGVLMAIVAFAAEAGASVIAEGIENQEMFDLVCQVSLQSPRMKIQLLQGYLLGRPSEEDPATFFARGPSPPTA